MSRSSTFSFLLFIHVALNLKIGLLYIYISTNFCKLFFSELSPLFTVGLYQGSALTRLLLAVIMDRITDEVKRELPWTMLFADDIVICEETRE